ncbi:formate/nitrite transporter family protein [Boudabousia tangfeifanii]|nr:formate/nitrite transporter family protein [Boudabousia tangfeifanii]
MLTLPAAMRDQAISAQQKALDSANFSRYFVSSMLAGAFVGIGGTFMLTAAGPLRAAHHPLTALVGGLVFTVGLMAVVFAGAELATSAMMTLPLGGWNHRANWGGLSRAFGIMLLGNFVGSVIFAALVWGSQIFAKGPGREMLFAIGEAKTHLSVSAGFFRAVLCNILVCLAIWAAGRAETEGAKIAAIVALIGMFASSGFEHVVANMTLLPMAYMYGAPGVTLGGIAYNLAVVLVGNIVGGAIFVALPYWYLTSQQAEAAAN